ncbi:5-oxoprolinase subunit B family protein [Aeromicrobium sp. P5_D10]
MNVRPYGDRALLIDCEDLTQAQAWFAALDGQAEVVLGARTVLVRGALPEIRALIAGTRPRPPAGDPGITIEIPVNYDGPDLDEVARLTGLSVEEIVVAHTGTVWTVAFGGFAPGFSYLVGGDRRLAVPRRSTPRTAVPSGAVGLAGGFSGIYPRESPGGWQLIGHTTVQLWNSRREPPALLTAGSHVRFVVA